MTTKGTVVRPIENEEIVTVCSTPSVAIEYQCFSFLFPVIVYCNLDSIFYPFVSDPPQKDISISEKTF